ncbi:acetyl-CoA carboxylase biotin carboxyl carrier protein [Prosthecochloris sp. HL-130-GSB]|uniref:acetyl-CoA carboxylase biotin carboxyl carrier protein n=1 Tax=Prosthecochloris sp. HL-130-GSB TaxID=1974213 RepID=UPI000A1C034F|nr:acetyl-CoA carboxylase, biotin carboxyl carrier protein [Prosthecochloris sp. HL-130-GSB]
MGPSASSCRSGVSCPRPPPAQPVQAPEQPAAPPAKTADDDLIEIRSPIVGTFYRSPSPDSDPFVNNGNRVQKGDILCIIEAMKLMNEIEAEVSGNIVDILIENGQPVEYDQVLFLLKP